MESVSKPGGEPKTEADARLLSALDWARKAGWLGSERQLAQQLGLATAVFYKVRKGLQSFPKEALLTLEAQLGLNLMYVRQGHGEIFAWPQVLSSGKGSVYERVRLAALATGLTAQAVRGQMGLAATAWRLLERGSEDQIKGLAQALQRAFPGLSIAWLLLGAGQPHPGGPVNTQKARTLDALPSSRPAQDEVLYLPFIDLRARAGFVESYLQGLTPNDLPLRPTLPQPGVRNINEALLIEVEGDSMSPTLCSKDVLLIVPVQPADWKYASGGIYVVVYGSDHLVVKRIIRNTLATEGILNLVSDNPQGGAIDLEGQDLRALFRVLAVTRSL